MVYFNLMLLYILKWSDLFKSWSGAIL